MQVGLGELVQMHVAAAAADMDQVVEVMIKQHIDFEVRKDRFKHELKK